jgi:hypothetical protein
MEFMRAVLGLIGIFCAYMLGRSVAAVRRGWQKKSRIYGWAIRTAACMLALTIRRPLDLTEIVVWCVAAAVAGLGYWITWRRKPEDDLTKAIFEEKE